MITSEPSSPLVDLEETLLGGTTPRRGDVVIARGEGCWLWDVNGKRYLDLGSAQGVAMLGHCHPKLSAAVAEQAHRLISCPSFLYNDTRANFVAKLASLLPSHLQHLFLANSGAEAIDGDQFLGHRLQRSFRIVCCVRAVALCLLGS